jgi:hypothetical protein
LAKNPESGLKMLGAKTNPEKISKIQGEMIINAHNRPSQTRSDKSDNERLGKRLRHFNGTK